MHALTTPILLRMAGLDALNTDPQAEPPHGELAQVEQRMCGSERHTVIAADVGGQTTLFKKPFKHSESVFLFRGGQRFAGQQIITDLPDSFCPVTIQRMSINARQAPRIICDGYLQGTGTPRTMVSAELRHEIF